ncbi:MAG: DUF2059 domain-containing protein [Rhodothermales bacterium]
MKSRFASFLAFLSLTVVGQVYAQAPSAHKQAALDLLEVSQAEKNIDEAIEMMLSVQLEQNPMMSQFEDILRDYITKYMAWDGLVDEYAQIYMDAFTEAELRDIIAYYRTETGQKAVTLMPTIMQQGAMIGQRKMMEHQDELEASIMERFEQLSAEMGEDAFGDGGFTQQEMLAVDSTGSIFRVAHLWPEDTVALDQPIREVSPLVFRLSDGIFQVKPEFFGEAQAITLFTDAEGRIREMRFDYDSSYVFDEMKVRYETLFGMPAIFIEGASSDLIYWEDGATRFEIVLDRSLGEGSIHASLRNR